VIQVGKMALVGEQLSAILHEINTPFAVVKARVDLINEMPEIAGDNLPGIKDHLQKIQKNTERVLTLLKGFSNFNRPATKASGLFSLNDAVGEAHELMAILMRGEPISLAMNLATTVPQIVGDPGWVQQIAINLIVVSTEVDANQATLKVADNGKGIPSHEIPSIFDSFFTTKPRGKGTGLGLNIVKTLAEKMHGKIRVTSTLGVGTEFIIEFPVAHETGLTLDETAVQKVATKSDLDRRILICEDEQDIRTVLGDIFAIWGYSVDLADDGDTGLELLRKNYYSHVLCDVKLPRMAGDEMMKSAAAEKIHVGKVYFMTGHVFSSVDLAHLRTIHPNVQDALLKPVSIQRLEEMFNPNSASNLNAKKESA
jgi:CheY-like chemotaxis protein